MRNFEYYCPGSIKEALSLLRNYKRDAKVLAGGTDLIVQMKEGGIQPAVLIDIKKIPDLNRLELKKNNTLHIGAAVPLSKVTAFTPVIDKFAVLYQACSLIGSVQIRNRATIGGNICNAAPSADSLPALLCLDAKAVLQKSDSKRKVLLKDFFTGPGKTIIDRDELLIEIEIQVPSAYSYGCYLRHTPREEMDIGIVGVASYIITDSNNICKKARIVLASVAPIPVTASKAENILLGKPLTEETISEASKLAVTAASPISDIRGSAGYRSEIVKVLTSRTLNKIRESITHP